MPETVLFIGATGNIGVSAIMGTLRARNYHVLAVVRNQASAEKMFQHVGTRENITTVEADIMSKDSLLGLVERVHKGEVPAFQHVFVSAGGFWSEVALLDATEDQYRKIVETTVRPSLIAYQTMIPYLLTYPPDVDCSWTLCTGAQGDRGQFALPALGQGSLFSLCHAGKWELQQRHSSIRLNELYLSFLVQVDELAQQTGSTKASDFAVAYPKILTNRELKGQRVFFLPDTYQGEVVSRELATW